MLPVKCNGKQHPATQSAMRKTRVYYIAEKPITNRTKCMRTTIHSGLPKYPVFEPMRTEARHEGPPILIKKYDQANVQKLMCTNIRL